METIIILSEKKWHEKLVLNLRNRFPQYKWLHIKNKEGFTLEELQEYQPTKIFIPHWSYLISENIYDHFECIL